MELLSDIDRCKVVAGVPNVLKTDEPLLQSGHKVDWRLGRFLIFDVALCVASAFFVSVPAAFHLHQIESLAPFDANRVQRRLFLVSHCDRNGDASAH